MKQRKLFGYKLNILIIADTCMGYANSLCEFFNKYEDVNCITVSSDDEYVSRVSRFGKSDFIIIADYLRNNDNYEIIYSARFMNIQACTLFCGQMSDEMELYCDAYGINDFFDDSLPFEKLADRIKYLQYSRINGFDFEEDHIFSDLTWHDNRYSIKSCSNESIISLRSLGIRPAGSSSIRTPAVRYDELYVIDNNCLFLDSLNIPVINGIFPDINGKKPHYNAIQINYRKLMLEVPYTGNIIISRNRYNHEKYEKLFELKFQEGEVVACDTIRRCSPQPSVY